MAVSDFNQHFLSPKHSPARWSWPASDRAMILGIIALCWAFYFIVKFIFDVAIQNDPIKPLPGRMAIILVGAGLSYLMYLAFKVVWGRSLVLVILLVPLSSAAVAIPFAVLNWWMAYTFSETSTPALIHSIIAWSASVQIFFAHSIAIIAFLYAKQLRAQEAQAVDAEKSLRQAELKALRYQINPHFLFNALNSVSALLNAKRPEEAEQMINLLADHYEHALTAMQDERVPVAGEVEAQLQYLNIERIRFPDRLEVEVDIAEGLGSVLVPALMLQPLVENSIKFGVANATSPVTVGITVQQRGRNLEMTVTDICEDTSQRPVKAGVGTGTGLENVRNRLATVYGDRASLAAGPVPGGFQARITLPIERPAP
jgi:two-component system LytT family sensor kinase